MPTVVRMPEVLANATEAVIQSWLVSVRQAISVGDTLAEVETDKALVELSAEVGGILGRLIAEPGVAIAVGAPIAVVLAPGETDSDLDPTTLGGSDEATVANPKPTLASAQDTSPPNSGRRLFATPLVRKLAREKGIDLETVSGSGPGRRIVRRDLDRLTTQEPQHPPTPASNPVAPDNNQTTDFTDIPLTGMRKAIARRLTESKTSVPHFYVKADCRVDALIGLRRSVNEATTIEVSPNDFILKAVAGALVEVPEANAIWNGTSLLRFNGVDISVAVAVEGGLLTPVLRGVDTMALSVVASEVAELAQRARDGRLKQDELEGGTFSVSNLGMYGVTEFSAILNLPQSGILAVGGATPRPVVIDGELVTATVMTVTLSADHRVIDGAVAAQWMAAFVRRIENPLSIVI